MNSALSPSPTFTPSEYLDDGATQLGWFEAAASIFGAAAGVYSTIEANKRSKRDAETALKLATPPPAPTAAAQSQWIPGVSNGIVIAGVGLVAVAALALVVRR